MTERSDTPESSIDWIRIATIAGGIAVALLLAFAIWYWAAWREYCPPGHSLQLTRLSGELAGQDAYAGDGQKGVREQMLGPGRHFLNPFGYKTKSIENVVIEPGEVGIVKNSIGADLPPDRFIAKSHEKGTQRRVLTPGAWRINIFGQTVEKRDAVIIPPGYVGVVTLRASDQKGVLPDVLQPGYYNINPVERRVDVIEVGYREWNVSSEYTVYEDAQGRKIKKFRPSSGVSFPLADGKYMYLDFTVIWGIQPENAPQIVEQYGTIAMVEQKVIEPQVLSICKNEGSNFTTMGFISGEKRQEFQRKVEAELKQVCEEKGVHILIALVRNLHPDESIRRTIQERMIAHEEQQTIRIEQQADTVAAKLREAHKQVDIAIGDFDAQTQSLIAKEQEEGEKRAAEIRANADREVARFQKEIQTIEADIERIRGQAAADVVQKLRESEASRFDLLVRAYGDPALYNLATFAEQLPADMRLRYRYAGDGTLWTDIGDLSDAADLKILENKRDQ